MSGSSKVSLHGLQFFPELRQISDVSCVADFPALRFPPGSFGLGTPQVHEREVTKQQEKRDQQ